MAKLNVALVKGFREDEVLIHAQGRDLYHKEGVSTREEFGFADSFEVELANGLTKLEISLPTRRLEAVIQLTLDQPHYVHISVSQEGKILHDIYDEPVGFA